MKQKRPYLNARLSVLVFAWSLGVTLVAFSGYRLILHRGETEPVFWTYLFLGLTCFAVIYGIQPGALRRLDAHPTSLRASRIVLPTIVGHLVTITCVIASYVLIFESNAEPVDWVMVRLGVPYAAIVLPVSSICLVQLGTRADTKILEQRRNHSQWRRTPLG